MENGGVLPFPSIKNLVLSGTSQSIFTFPKLNMESFFKKMAPEKGAKKTEVYRSPLEIQTQSTFGVICRLVNIKVCVCTCVKYPTTCLPNDYGNLHGSRMRLLHSH